MAPGRANSSNSINGTTQVTRGNNAPPSVNITTFPRPAGQLITVTRLNGAMIAAGAAVGDTVERDSDGGFFDTTAGCLVPCDYTSYQTGNDMVSN